MHFQSNKYTTRDGEIVLSDDRYYHVSNDHTICMDTRDNYDYGRHSTNNVHMHNKHNKQHKHCDQNEHYQKKGVKKTLSQDVVKVQRKRKLKKQEKRQLVKEKRNERKKLRQEKFQRRLIRKERIRAKKAAEIEVQKLLPPKEEPFKLLPGWDHDYVPAKNFLNLKNKTFIENATDPVTGKFVKSVWVKKVMKPTKNKELREKYDLQWQYYRHRKTTPVASIYKKYHGCSIYIIFSGDPEKHHMDL